MAGALLVGAAALVRRGLRARARDAREGLRRPRAARPRRVEHSPRPSGRGAARARGRESRPWSGTLPVGHARPCGCSRSRATPTATRTRRCGIRFRARCTRAPATMLARDAVARGRSPRSAGAADPKPETTTLATMAASLIGGVYVLPWYPAWALPTAGARTAIAALGARGRCRPRSSSPCTSTSCPRTRRCTGAWGAVRAVIVQAGAWLALAAFVAARGPPVAAGGVTGVAQRAPAPRRSARRRCRPRRRRARGAAAEQLIRPRFARPPSRSAASAPADARNQPADVVSLGAARCAATILR